jgi:putative membrane protein
MDDAHLVYVAWQLDPVLLGSLFTLAVCYALAVGPLRRRLAPGAPFPAARAAVFAVGLALTYLTEGSPLHDLAERYLFSAHMFQHLLISYICTPLLMLGVPVWLWRILLLNRAVRPVAGVLLNPLVAGVTFSLAISLWHFPAIYEPALQNSALHHAQHIVFMFFAFLSWWPVLSPLPELRGLPHGAQILYLFFISTVLQLPLFALVTFSDQPFYQTYANAPRILFDSALADQQAAGVVMKVQAMIVFTIVVSVVFARWYRESNPPRPAPKRQPSP